MRQSSCLVTVENGPRPAGKPDECFYCQRKLGEEHLSRCVLRSRTVVVRVTIEMVRQVPDDWTAEDIEFHINDSSWCADNIVDDLTRFTERGEGCLCRHLSAEYVREATAEDENTWGVRAADVE